MNLDVPHFKAQVVDSFFYDGDSAHEAGLTSVIVFGIRAAAGRAIGFHVMTERGAMYSPLPIHALRHSRVERLELLELGDLELWDAFGDDVNLWRSTFLSERRCRVWFPHRKAWVHGTSLGWALDFHGNGWSDDPSEWKCLHMIALDNGQYALQSNNRVLWFDASFIARPYGADERPSYKVNTRTWSAENESERTTEDSNAFFYGAGD